MTTSLRRHNSVTYGNSDDIFNLTIKDGYEFFFVVHANDGGERNAEQALAIMKCQYRILGELIEMVESAVRIKE